MAGRREPTPFGRAIKMRLAELNMKQSDLARQLGTSNAYVTYLIYGDRRDEAWVMRICEVLGMTNGDAELRELTRPVHADKGSGASRESVIQ